MIDLPENGLPARRRSGRPDKPIPRGDLLRTARELFAARGYTGVSMADIAHKAGLQKSSLFHHFPTKDALYGEVLEGVLVEVSTAVMDALQAAGRSHTERLDISGEALARSLGEDSTRARLIMRELLNEDGNKAHVESVVRIISATADFFADGATAGAWPHQDFKQLVMTLAGVHCFYFALPGITRSISGLDPFAPDAVGLRTDAIKRQVRHMLAIPTVAG
jgi:AcrR family transcriptional regulator